MALEEDYRKRDYLYGRLLAIAESIEEVALKHIVVENRPTNAARLMQRFSEQPFKTWLTIHNALDPYIQRLRSSEKWKNFLISRLNELSIVHDSFDKDDFKNNDRLSGEFLLGYHCQRQKFRTKTKTETPDEPPSQGDSE